MLCTFELEFIFINQTEYISFTIYSGYAYSNSDKALNEEHYNNLLIVWMLTA